MKIIKTDSTFQIGLFPKNDSVKLLELFYSYVIKSMKIMSHNMKCDDW